MNKLDDIGSYVQKVFTATSVTDKKKAFYEMIHNSVGSDVKKKKALVKVERMSALADIDSLAFNYSAAGEGLSVV